MTLEALKSCRPAARTSGVVAFFALCFLGHRPLDELSLRVVAHPVRKVLQVVDVGAALRPLLGQPFGALFDGRCRPSAVLPKNFLPFSGVN